MEIQVEFPESPDADFSQFYNKVLLEGLFTVPSLMSIQQVPSATLAYLGDAVYELYIRTQYSLPPKRIQAYHQQVVAQVRAEAQAQHLQLLHSHLTHAELEILRRGRNSASSGPKRLAPEIYQQATSLETLIGYLYLTDRPRLIQLLTYLQLPPTC